jgi:hypothetical protein
LEEPFSLRHGAFETLEEDFLAAVAEGDLDAFGGADTWGTEALEHGTWRFGTRFGGVEAAWDVL